MKNYFIKPFWVILFLFFLINKMKGQELWTKVQAPVVGNFLHSQQFGEEYYVFNGLGLLSTQKGIKAIGIKQTIVLPNENSEMETFSIEAIPLLSDALSRRFPNLKTYQGRSVSRPEVRVRLSTHSNGINAWLKLTDGPDFFIQTQKGKKNLHYAYLKSRADFAPSLSCKTFDLLSKSQSTDAAAKSIATNNEIRIFRIAIATTGEYTTFWGDNDDSNGTNAEDAYGAVVSSLNRISSVFEDEVKVRLELVSDESLIYEDAETDPFTGEYASELQTALDEVIGDDAYDVGHLFDYGQPNGDAGCIGCVCESGKKGQGFSTHPFRDIFGGEYRNDYFDLDYAGHEIGHQFGAYHTFSFNAEGTGYNAEPGSGSTIMAYAGITGEDDIQLHGDPYFHYYSIQNILDVVTRANCAVLEPYEAPIFTTHAGEEYYIPIGTAYKLEAAQVEEVEGTTYCWEQLDSGQVTSDSFGSDNVIGSLARSLPPTSDTIRTIPNPKQLMNNTLIQENPAVDDAWETVPTVGRILNWGLTVRRPFENKIQVAQDKTQITVVASAGSFLVSSHADSDIVIRGGTRETITWEVSHTDKAPINVSEVAIYLSSDGGLTFPVILANAVPNSGVAEVIIPNDIETSQARIKIAAKAGIFFAYNSSNFTIKPRNLLIEFDSYLAENCGADLVRYDFSIQRTSGFDAAFSPQINNLPVGVQASFSRTTYTSEQTRGYFTLQGLRDILPLDYDLFFSIVLTSESDEFPFVLKQRDENLNPPELVVPLDNAISQNIDLQFEWEDDTNVDSSRLQVSLTDNFNSFVQDTLLTQNFFSMNSLEPATTYYWRVQNRNICNEGAFSDIFSFTTNPKSCLKLSSVSLPINLDDATENAIGITTASIIVNNDLPILDINVLVDIEHTYVGDLMLYLESPKGIRYLLSGEIGESNDDYIQTLFDQEAQSAIFEAEAPFTGSFQPLQNISQLYGTSSFGTWKLIVHDLYVEDSGQLREFTLDLCVQGIPLANSDDDSIVDENDNCPLLTNENQEDIDGNGIGDVCDIFSTKNISLTKKNTSCPEKDNGSLTFNARAEYDYNVTVTGPDGYLKELVFTTQGRTLEGLAAGNYDICVRADSFPEFESCFETQITAPLALNVQAKWNSSTSILDLDLSGADSFNVSINNETKTFVRGEQVQVILSQKTNFIQVTTANPCQGIYEEWINLGENAQVYPNPVSNEARLILPRERSATVGLFSGAGDVIWESQYEASNNDVVLIPMNQLHPGWYLIRIDYDSYSETLKVLKQ